MKNLKGSSMLKHQQTYNLEKMTLKDFQRLSIFIGEHFGIHLPENKLPLVQSRLYKRLTVLGLSSYTDYCNFVLSNEGQQEITHLMNVISTNKTDFFREADHFDFLEKLIAEENFKNKNLRVWSAGSSSGEEAYTLAMVLENQLEKGNINSYHIHGSDISTNMIVTAIKGKYSFTKSHPIPMYYKKKYLFKNKDETVVKIDPILRKKVNFERQNLIKNDFTFPIKFDIVFCRNTLIYFTKETQKQVVSNLLSHTKENGYLFIGHSESLLNMDLNINRIKATIYRKNSSLTLNPE
jgi:chemotaxis protein methyltransferase CheR